MFFQEQVSVQPREKSMEDKARPIRDIMIMKIIEDKQLRLKQLELNVRATAQQSGSPSANNTIDRSPAHQLTPGYVIQAEVKQGTPIEVEAKRSKSVLLLDNKRSQMRIQ